MTTSTEAASPASDHVGPSGKVVVWDHPDPPPDDGGTTWLWRGHSDVGKARSLFAHVHRHAAELRERYLDWIDAVGAHEAGGRPVVEHLAVEAGFSLWWTTPFVECSPYSPMVADVVRLLALESLLERSSPQQIHLVSPDLRLHRVLERLAVELGIPFKGETGPGESDLASRPDERPWGAVWLDGLRTLVRLYRRAWRLRTAATSDWRHGPAPLLFSGYFANLDRDGAERGHYRSAYWGDLIALLHDEGLKTNWLHHNVLYPAADAVRWIRTFNRSDPLHFHTVLGAFLSGRGIVRIVGRWIRLGRAAGRLEASPALFKPPGSRLDLAPIARPVWRDATVGGAGMAVLVAAEGFDRALRSAPRQARGFYLFENAGWERAFLHAWRKHGHGEAIGVCHSTVRAWDLRYARTWLPEGRGPAMPRPDRVAVNGRAARRTLLELGADPRGMVDCEALRFLYLADRPARSPDRSSSGLRVLVLGDIDAALTRSMIDLLARAHPSQPGVSVHVKPHPVVAEALPQLPVGWQVVHEPLNELLQGFDLAIASASTSAAVDAWISGLPVVVVLDDARLNVSPLLGCSGVRFVADRDELVRALKDPPAEGDRTERHDYFYLDTGLPRWRALIESPSP